MNREITFRAWDKTNYQMLEVVGLSNLSKENTNDEPEWAHFKTIRDVATRRPASGITFEKVNWRPIAQFELMQYTGLKDKNGKEIYEGDVVQPYSNGTNFVVEWWHSGWYLVLENRHSMLYTIGRPEVIGNIHENPELLKP